MTEQDPRVSDEATGLPPLEEVEIDAALLVLAWSGGTGAVVSPHSAESVPVRWLHVRGLVREGDGSDPTKVEWAQLHLAVPVEHAVDVAATLASGGAFDEQPEG